MTHDSDGKPSAAWALTTASTTSERSPGVTTATPSVSRSSTCSAVMPATRTPITSRASSAGSPLHKGAFDRFCKIGHRRRDQQRLLGQHVGLRFEALQRLGDRCQLRRVTTVGHHRRGVGVLGGDLGQAHARRPGRPRSGVRSFALHRQHDRRTQVGRDAGVDGQLARGGDVGVVAADDQHRVTLVGHMVEPVDDVGDAPRRDLRATVDS